MAVFVAFCALLGLGVFLGLVLAWASRKLHVETNPLVEEIEKVLPGANCGACGKPGCSGYANALVLEGAPLNLCKPGGQELSNEIAKLLGKEQVVSHKKVAFVYCKGGTKAKDKFTYSGRATCAHAVLVSGGQKQCAYGCLGFGDCVTVCDYDAIKLSPEGYPVVDENKCVDCLACIKACPKNLIKETMHKTVQAVICSSHDKGAVSKAACAVACIACGICVKSCPFQAITMDNFLAVIDPEKCTNCGICTQKCPTKAIA